MFSYRTCPDEHVPKTHPLRRIKTDVERVLAEMSSDSDHASEPPNQDLAGGYSGLKADVLDQRTQNIAFGLDAFGLQGCHRAPGNLIGRVKLERSPQE